MIMIHHLLLLQGTIAHILEMVYVACVPLSHRGGPHNVESIPCDGRTNARETACIFSHSATHKVVAFLCGFKIFEEKRNTKVLGELHSPIFSALV